MKYRLTIMAILLIALFISAACSSETDSGGGSEASSAGTSAVKAETLVNINLREGPGTNYLAAGQNLNIIRLRINISAWQLTIGSYNQLLTTD